jgi:hypothetical protein
MVDVVITGVNGRARMAQVLRRFAGLPQAAGQSDEGMRPIGRPRLQWYTPLQGSAQTKDMVICVLRAYSGPPRTLTSGFPCGSRYGEASSNC